MTRFFFSLFSVGKNEREKRREGERDIIREKIDDDFLFYSDQLFDFLTKSFSICGRFTNSSLVFSFSRTERQVNTFICETLEMID